MRARGRGRKGSILKTLLGLLTIGFLLPSASAPEIPIRIGAINPLTGQFAAQGRALHQGIQYAVEEVNRRGGLKGVKLALLTRDDEGRPERAVAAAEELLAKQKVVALVGGYVDSLVGPVAEVAERHKTPYLAAASLDERLVQRGFRYFFRMSSLEGYLDATAGAILHLFKAKRVALLSSNTPGASQLAARQRLILQKAGVEVPVYEFFTSGLSDFTPLLLRVRDAKVDVLLSNAFFADHLLMIRQLHGLRITVKAFLGTFGMEFPEVVKELGPLSEFLFGTTGWEPGVTLPGTEAESSAFVRGFRARFGTDPPPLAMHGYGAARALIAALEATLAKGLPPSGETLRNELANLDLLLPLERLRFAEGGEPLFYRRVLIQIQGGKPIVVYPPDRATGPVVYPMPPWKGRR